MARLHQELAESLLNCTNAEKEEMGNKIVMALGGDVKKFSTGLPLRRGNSDGGIDGRIPIIIEGNEEFRRGSKILSSGIVRKVTNAAFSIKIERKDFNRNELNAFIGDMEREKIFDGIIVSVKPLSRDAAAEFERHNREGSIRIRHILIEDLLARNINIDFELESGDSFENMFIRAIRSYTNSG